MSGSGGGGGGGSGAGGGAAGDGSEGYPPVGYPPAAPTAPAAPPPPSAFDTDIERLIELIRANSGRFTGVADSMAGIATGADDPAFAAARAGRLNALRAATGTQLGEVGDFYGGRGLGGSSADLNARLKVMQGAGLQEQQVMGDIDLQNISRRDAMLTGQLDPITAMLSLEAIPPALRAQMEAAQNAGEGGGSGGGGGIGGTVICTLLYNRGDLPEVVYKADCEYGRKNVDMDTFQGYYAWAKPLAKVAETRPRLYAVLRFLGRAWAYQMAWRMGVVERQNRLGAALQTIGQPLCGALGVFLRWHRKAQRSPVLRIGRA